MASHAASAFRRSYPSGQLVWAIDPRCQPVVATSDGWDPFKGPATLVNDIFSVDWSRWKREKASPLVKIRRFLELRKYQFDAAVDLQGQGKTAICLRLCGAKKKLASRATDLSVRPFAKVMRHPNDLHWVEEQLRTVDAVIPLADQRLVPIMPKLDLPDVDPRLVTISVGSGHPVKTYPHMGEVGTLLARSGVPIAYLGGPGESAPNSEGRDLVNKLTLRETMGYLKASCVHLASDTGSGHIAAAYGIPVVSIFGYMQPSKCAPYTHQKRIFDVRGSMSDLAPHLVAEAVEEMLACRNDS